MTPERLARIKVWLADRGDSIGEELVSALETERARLNWLIERCEYLSGDRYERDHIDRSMAREAEQCS